MNLIGSVDALRASLDYHLARHNLLTSNLAHVDTPAYRARELYRTDKVNSFAGVLDAQMTTTDARHLGGSTRPPEWRVDVDRFAPVGPDGNSVNLDRETVKVASNNLRYSAVSQLTRGELDGLMWAARDGR